jgi:hypothetical protein
MSDLDWRQRLARWAPALLIVAGLLASWSAVLTITGGVLYDVGPLRLSSRNPSRPLLVAALLGVIAWRLAYVDKLESRLQRLEAAGRAAGLAIALAAALCALAFGAKYGVRAAGGSDQFGYVSESALLRHGQLKIDQGFAATMPWPHPQGSFAPLAYVPSADGAVMVPTYPPGLALVMAAARLISRCALYYVAPVCGALLVILTYLLGRRVFGHVTATVAAVFTAASPTVDYMSLLPMSDVPAATCWTGALVVAKPSSTVRALFAGALTGLALAIRPNLAPLAVFPWLLLMAARPDLRAGVARTLAFGAGVGPFVAFVAWVNQHLYGSPFTSGYGSLLPGFAFDFAAANLKNYPSWWLESQGILAFLFVFSLFGRHTARRRETTILMLFAAAVFLAYLFYTPFDAWWFLRFLLPAIPLLFLLSVDAIQWATSRFSLTLRLVAVAGVAVVSLNHAIGFSRQAGIATIGEGEQKYVDAGVFIDRVTPPEAVVISLQHSGNIRYYSGRLTIRYDGIDSEWLDRAIEALERSGRPVYLLLEDFEVPRFRQRFAGQRSLAHLERGPAATGRGGQLLFYPINAAPFEQASPRIPRISRDDCRDISPGFLTAGQQ